MRCTCCGRAINPTHAYTSGNGSYGPVCAVKLGLMKQSPPITRKPSRFAIFSRVNPVRVEDGQIDIFGVIA